MTTENKDTIILAVYQLGSDNNAWFVTGTHDIEIARGAVEQFLIATVTPEADEFENILAYLNETETESRHNWYWTEDESGNRVLRWVNHSLDIEDYDEEIFSGVRFYPAG
jgi:hypothetical protein